MNISVDKLIKLLGNYIMKAKQGNPIFGLEIFHPKKDIFKH